ALPLWVGQVSIAGSAMATLHKDMVESESAAAAPFFIKKPTIQKLVEGGSVVFECQIGGSPKPHIIWKKSGSLVDTERVRSSQSGGFLSLVIQGVGVADQGTYRCTATNEHGHNSSSAQLTVEGG
uniref:Ig-like domain-containing protein n=1 Tax=Pundamilia nyererei TaxID=303518 RepID=A0A3B4H903_9CICH